MTRLQAVAVLSAYVQAIFNACEVPSMVFNKFLFKILFKVEEGKSLFEIVGYLRSVKKKIDIQSTYCENSKYMEYRAISEALDITIPFLVYAKLYEEYLALPLLYAYREGFEEEELVDIALAIVKAFGTSYPKAILKEEVESFVECRVRSLLLEIVGML